MTIEAELVSAVGSHRGVAAADRICSACVDLLAVDAAAISLVFDGANAGTLGASNDQARTYDELQFIVGEGPCLESVQKRGPVLVVDLAADVGSGRWPGYGPALLAHGIGAVFAIPVLVAGEYVGALDLFRHGHGRLSDEVTRAALVAAELAEMPLLDLLSDGLNALVNGDDPRVWTELNAVTRTEVSQATGMLVAQLEITPAQALVRLRAHAFAAGRSTTAVARDILEHRLRLDPQ